MIFIRLLVTMALVTLAKASSMSYSTHRRRAIPLDVNSQLMLLYDIPYLENTGLSPRSDWSDLLKDSDDSNVQREKKVGFGQNSLSVVNPIDVLRQRVLLELGRRKAMQDQHQVDANRRILEKIGKRSSRQLDPDYPRTVAASENDDIHIYTNDRSNNPPNEQHETYTQQIPAERKHEWYDVGNAVLQGNRDDGTRKILTTYYHDIM